ncbi:MAG: LysR substrate-binding domain-containing protein [Pseudomonadota bacterium]
MKLSQLHNLLAIVEQGSLRAAARHLGLAQPTLTRSIQELERELGVSLFERGQQGITLTAMGQRFINRAQKIDNDARQALDEIRQLQGAGGGTLNVCLSTMTHLAFLPYALKTFRARYPNVFLDIREGQFRDVEDPLKNGMIDCYIGPSPEHPVSTALHVEKVLDHRRVIVCRRGHPLAGARSLRELANAEWITTSVTGKAQEELGPLFAGHGLPAPRLVMRANTALTFITSIVSSDLLAMLPVEWTHSEVTRNLVDSIEIDEVLPAPPLCIAWRASLPLTPAADYFCDLIRRAIAHARPLAAVRSGIAPVMPLRQPGMAPARPAAERRVPALAS